MSGLFITLTVAVHLLGANLASGGPLVCLWMLWATRRDDAAALVLGRRLLRDSMAALTGAILLGGVALAMVWVWRPEPFFQAAAQIETSRYWFGIAELLFYYLTLVIAWRLWPREGVATSARRFWTAWIAILLAGTNLIYHFPTLLTIIGVMRSRPAALGQQRRFVEWLGDAEVQAGVLHFVLASLAVTGIYVAWLASRSGTAPANVRWLVRGARIALAATVIQMASGVWMVLALSGQAQQQLLGGDGWSLAMLLAALTVTLSLLYRLALLACGEVGPGSVRAVAWHLVLVVLMMVGVQQRLRDEAHMLLGMLSP